MNSQVPHDGSRSVHPAAPQAAKMTQTGLFAALEALESRGFESVTSRRKPLALLWAIGRIAAGQSRLIEWRDFRDGMPPLQQRYARPLQTPDPQYPFWDLRRSVLWEVVGDNGRLRHPPTLSWLDSNNPSAGLTPDVATLLKDPAIRSRAVRTLLDRFFFDVDRKSLRADLGLSEYTPTAGPLGNVPPAVIAEVTLGEDSHSEVTTHQPLGVEVEAEVAPGTATPPQGRQQDPAAPLDAALPTSQDQTPTGEEQASHLVCQAALRGVGGDANRIVVVVEARSDADTSMFGFAWLTADGELRTGIDRSYGPYDNAIQAICLAALDLDDGATGIHLVCRDAKAANVVSRILQSGSTNRRVDGSLAGRTRHLIAEVARRRGRISASWDPCPQPHDGAAAARHLANLALQAARGLESSRTVQAEADKISEMFGHSSRPQLISPEEEGDHTWWESDGGDNSRSPDGLIWHAALYRMHIEGGWCPLPAGPMRQGRDGQRLRLRIEHKDRLSDSPGAEHDVTLRRRGGDWELHGVRWPRGVHPGTVVTVRWPNGTSLVTARTTLLHTPERVDGVEFLHRYDPQVVTRESAPGSEQDVDVPDLSDAAWVLRALRVLGYLSADGTATLAEAALARNCERLGLATSRLSRLPVIVEQLVRAGRVQRVQGSLGRDGRPSYPARAGHVPVELLRYVPDVEALDPSVRQMVQNVWNRNRGAHWVAGFVRRLPPGAQASAEQIELHLEAVHAAEVVDQWLPEGYTYVRRHRRGGSA